MKDLHFDTVEEMIAWVIQNPNYKTRFNICERAMWKEGDEYAKYYLSCSSPYNHSMIEISMELGEKLYGAWPKKPYYKGSSHLVPSGVRTLAGILKLLGQNDITLKVKEAKDKEKAESEKRKRNSYRKLVKEKIDAVEMAVFEANKISELHFELPSFSELLSSLQEEE